MCAEVDGCLALLGQFALGPRVLGDEHANGADSFGEADRVDEHVQRGGGVLVALGIVGLVAHAFATTVSSEPHRLVQHSLHGFDLGVVDGNRTDLLGARAGQGGDRPPSPMRRP